MQCIEDPADKVLTLMALVSSLSCCFSCNVICAGSSLLLQPKAQQTSDSEGAVDPS
jgi:hypothetical protein